MCLQPQGNILSSNTSVCMYQQLQYQWTFMKFDIKQYDKELSCHINFYLDRTILMTILHEDLQALASQV